MNRKKKKEINKNKFIPLAVMKKEIIKKREEN
jgi:hypothetical protein